MVAKSGRYFGHQFKGYQGVTQVNPLSPTIFNVVMDAIIRHRVTVVTSTEAITVRVGLTTIYLTAYFYAEHGFVASTKTERLQKGFDVLTGLFVQHR